MQAALMVEVLKRCGNDLTRENVMHRAANSKNLRVPMFLDGITANTSPTDFDRSSKCACCVSMGSDGIILGRS